MTGAVTYAVGDIHGRYDLLRALLAAIAADIDTIAPERRVTCVFLGDYVDRGPDSATVMTTLLWLARHAPFDCVFLRGNHEQVMLDYIADPLAAAAWLDFGGLATLRSYGVAVDPAVDDFDHVALRDRLLDRLPAAHLDFLHRLAYRHEVDGHLFVHAGVRPGVALANQDEDDLLWIRDDFLLHKGAFPMTVVHGHSWTSARPDVQPNRIGIDTGAYQTGVLTAIRIDGTARRFIAVDEAEASGAYPVRNDGAIDGTRQSDKI